MHHQRAIAHMAPYLKTDTRVGAAFRSNDWDNRGGVLASLTHVSIRNSRGKTQPDLPAAKRPPRQSYRFTRCRRTLRQPTRGDGGGGTANVPLTQLQA